MKQSSQKRKKLIEIKLLENRCKNQFEWNLISQTF